MKTAIPLLLCFASLTSAPAFGPSTASAAEPAVPVQESNLTKFDLDFPGGTPGELVAAIEKAMGRPLNAIIPIEHAEQRLPPLKMSGVYVPQLFQALSQASHERKLRASGNSMSETTTTYGFATTGNASDRDAVWHFYTRGDETMPSVSRFYLLTPYLESGLTVDDITTAIQTGWKMLGESPRPQLSFHPETKLLIAVGEAHKLATIEAVLNALSSEARSAASAAETKESTPPNR